MSGLPPSPDIARVMANYRLTQLAEADLHAIADYSATEFGLAQASQYFAGLDQCLEMLANTPLVGREAEDLAPAVRRFLYQVHVVFYRPTEYGVLIVRVLHRRMDVDRHLLAEDFILSQT